MILPILILAAMSVVRLAILAAYVVLVCLGYPWWAVPLLVLFALGLGCKPPAAVIAAASPAGRVGP